MIGNGQENTEVYRDILPQHAADLVSEPAGSRGRPVLVRQTSPLQRGDRDEPAAASTTPRKSRTSSWRRLSCRNGMATALPIEPIRMRTCVNEWGLRRPQHRRACRRGQAEPVMPSVSLTNVATR